MTKQMLYYENVAPVSAQHHKDWALEQSPDFEFAGHSNSVPLSAGEFAAAAGEYAIVFAGNEGALSPVVILGLDADQNLFLDENNQWTATYIPAFVRRYPFVFARSGDGSKLTLCIDEQYSGWNQDGRGNRLFNDNGERSDYLERVMTFVQEYQRDFTRTQALCGSLEKLELLAPMAARFQLPSGKKAQLTGFRAIDREKLAGLPDDKLAEMVRNGQLEFIYAHLLSLRNLERVLARGSANYSGTGGDTWDALTERDTASTESTAH